MKVSNRDTIAKAPTWLRSIVRKPNVEHDSVNADDWADRTNHTKLQAQKLLRRLDPDENYDKWLKILMGLKHQFGPAGFDLADEWCSPAPKYEGRAALRRKWKSLKGNGITFATVAMWAKKSKASDTSIVFRHISEIVAERREPEWLREDVLEMNVLAVIAGQRNTLKSFVVIDWAMHAAVAGHGAVILSGEGAGLDRRIDAWMRTHAPDRQLCKLPVLAFEGILNLNEDEVVTKLAEAVKKCGYEIRLVVVDTLSKYSPGIEENDNAAVAEFLSRLAVKIRDDLAVTVLLVAHTGHAAPGRPRGAYALMANPDAEYIVDRRSEYLVTVTRERFKDTPALPPLAYMATVVDLGRMDSRLRDVTSLALIPTDPPEPEGNKKPLGPNQQLVMNAVHDCMGKKGFVSESTVVDRAVEQWSAKPKKGERDRRAEHVRGVIRKLIANDVLVREGKNLKVQP
jgi:KaiC/GvpD/RAD55 family RecA-like ATPase